MDIISQFISCVVTPNELQTAVDAGYTEIYVLTGEKENPIIKHHKLRGQNRYIRLAVTSLPTNYKSEKIVQEVNFLPAGKIPVELFDQVVAFFKQVMEVKKSELEAMIWICWDQENGYHLIVPDQRVSKASASYDWASLPAGKTIVADIHSHNTMGAFFSGTDNRDDQSNIGFSGVVGRLKDANPQTVWRFNYRAQKLECDLDDIFTMPARPEVAVPEDWISKIQTPTYNTTVYGGNSQKGKADHLKAWQYKRGDAANVEREGSRMGPQLQDQRRLLPGEPGDTRDIDWQGDFWGLAQDLSLRHPDDSFLDLAEGGDERATAAERALSYLREDPEYPSGVAGLAEYNPVFDPDVVDQRTGEIRGNRYDESHIGLYAGDDRYDEARDLHGHEVAEAFCVIDDMMSQLDGKDELVENIMADMIHMATPGFKETLFKRLYQELPDEVQERIQTNGIH
jgi:PRTRC genetic system protein A